MTDIYKDNITDKHCKYSEQESKIMIVILEIIMRK